jgi:hypothetical protein
MKPLGPVVNRAQSVLDSLSQAGELRQNAVTEPLSSSDIDLNREPPYRLEAFDVSACWTKKRDCMSKRWLASRLGKRVSPSTAFFARVLLHAAILFVVALLPCSPSSFGLSTGTESEAPMDEDGSSEEEAITVQARSRVRRIQFGLPALLPPPCGLSFKTTGNAGDPPSGHRLSSHLLAPLRC